MANKHIFLTDTYRAIPYTAPGARGAEPRIPVRSRLTHADRIEKALEKAFADSLLPSGAVAVRTRTGTYLEFRSQRNHDLITGSLENTSRNIGIRLLNVRVDEEKDITSATVYIPSGQEKYFFKKIEEYATKDTELGKPKNQSLVDSIDEISCALPNAFWTSTTEIPDETKCWCEVWLRSDIDDHENVKNDFFELCNQIGIDYKENYIVFPERVVLLARLNRALMGALIRANDSLAEIRLAAEATSFFTELDAIEQQQWIDNLVDRLDISDSQVSVCILDTGINDSHPLLSKSLDEESVHTINQNWGSTDEDGHGTEVAGIALFDDLKRLLLSGERHSLSHRIESVKILSPSQVTDPDLYGGSTQDAVAIAEIFHPEYSRIICMAVTAKDGDEVNTGRPSSWSGAIDDLLFKRSQNNDKAPLFLVSAGNVYPQDCQEIDYPSINTLKQVLEPGQSWNALTVGAYSNDVTIQSEDFRGCTPVSDIGELSPYSRTSVLWESKWPIKPDILCDGGNMANTGEYYTECPDLSRLTTGNDLIREPLTLTWATSAAVAQASWFAAQIANEYPNMWPETIRALMVHSARWTDQMKKQFCGADATRRDRLKLLRTCGYGIPDLQRALECEKNSVNMIIEGVIQPFEKKSMKEMHFHRIPWPESVLEGLGEVEAELRVTLSYYIEPGPGEVGWKDKYRYPSHGLRFAVINKNQSVEDFIKKVNAQMREEKNDTGAGDSGAKDWYLGVDNRNVGSIHSDFKTCCAVDLCEAKYIAVYPVVGWWRERSHLKREDTKTRYSLVVSISTPEVETDLYTEIVTQIEQPVEIPIPKPNI